MAHRLTLRCFRSDEGPFQSRFEDVAAQLLARPIRPSPKLRTCRVEAWGCRTAGWQASPPTTVAVVCWQLAEGLAQATAGT